MIAFLSHWFTVEPSAQAYAKFFAGVQFYPINRMSITYPAEMLRPGSFLNPLEHEKPQVHFNARSTHVKPPHYSDE